YYYCLIWHNNAWVF
nr:immunoglobulin light chain junction region [Macaca mulatta]